MQPVFACNYFSRVFNFSFFTMCLTQYTALHRCYITHTNSSSLSLTLTRMAWFLHFRRARAKFYNSPLNSMAVKTFYNRYAIFMYTKMFYPIKWYCVYSVFFSWALNCENDCSDVLMHIAGKIERRLWMSQGVCVSVCVWVEEKVFRVVKQC